MSLPRTFDLVRSLLLVMTCVLTAQGCAEVGSRAYFRESDETLQQAGRLRIDREAADVQYGNADLVEHFLRVAFGEEYTLDQGRYVAIGSEADAPLKRWGGPVRYWVASDGTKEDALAVDAFAEKLAGITRLDIAATNTRDDANLEINFLSAPGRERFGTDLATDPDRREMVELFSAWLTTPQWPCASEFYYQPRTGSAPYQIEFAVIYIRDELTGVSRQSCIEEEMSQALGLARDDPSVRPSIFNDDEEFALLTDHDVLLLRTLYDPRLTPGLTQQEALPIIQRIVGDLRPWEQ